MNIYLYREREKINALWNYIVLYSMIAVQQSCWSSIRSAAARNACVMYGVACTCVVEKVVTPSEIIHDM